LEINAANFSASSGCEIYMFMCVGRIGMIHTQNQVQKQFMTLICTPRWIASEDLSSGISHEIVFRNM